MATQAAPQPARRWGHTTPAREVRLGLRRIYILPTRHGIHFALVLLAMLFGAINYVNSLAFALTFLLGGLLLVSILHTYRNLRGLTLRAGRHPSAFAGDPVHFHLSIDGGPGERLALRLGLDPSSQQLFDLPAAGVIELVQPVPSQHRGWLALPELTIETRYPLGLFRAWAYAQLDSQALIYPRPAPRGPLPEGGGEGQSGSAGRGSDDFVALRPFHSGDSLRHVHWKAEAREQGLQVKLFGGNRSRQLWLDWEGLPGLAVEPRLALLTRWVVEAEQQGLRYGLLLPGQRIPLGSGDGHRHRCLSALALYGGGR